MCPAQQDGRTNGTSTHVLQAAMLILLVVTASSVSEANANPDAGTSPPPLSAQGNAASARAGSPSKAPPAPVRAPGSPDPLAPANLVAEPPLSQTGKVGTPGLEGGTPTKAMKGGTNGPRPEKSIAPTADAVAADRRPAPAQKAVPSRALQQQITERFRGLAQCRVEIARQKQVSAGQVRAQALLLRWTINPDGTVSAPEVVESAPADPAVMNCVKETMSRWTFAADSGSPLPVARKYKFPVLK
jgi:hypothetical protein